MHVALDAPRRPALRYYGGKHRLAPWIISFFPPHLNYVEPCAGACSVLLQKPRSPLETVNDLDGNVVNFFRVLRDRPDELIRRIQLTPWSRAEYELSLHPCVEQVETARRFYVRLWQSVNGGTHKPDSTAWRLQTNALGSDGAVRWVKAPAEFISIGEGLSVVAQRLRYVQIEQQPAIDVIRRYDNIDTLIYFDPPYVTETRAQVERYAFEWCDEDHEIAATLLRNCQGYVVISGYACPLYTELYERHGWQRHDKEANTNSGGKRIESVWLSPRTAEALAKPKQAGLFT